MTVPDKLKALALPPLWPGLDLGMHRSRCIPFLMRVQALYFEPEFASHAS